MIVKNPNFKNNGEFHRSLAAKGKGAKDFPNSHTEVEYLGKNKFAASIGVGHRVFFDKADGNKPKKHKLTDERPVKDYVLIQGPRCCVEVYPYYAKYYDVNHEEVRLYEERWVCQRLFKAPDTWRDVDAYNPVITVEEYSELAGDVVKATITYDTDYGTLTVEYFQRDGNALKHNVYFKNTSGSEETFRVLQKWAGIVGAKCNGKDIPVVEDAIYLAFHNSDKPPKQFNIAENLYGMVFNPDGSEKTDQCLQRPISIESHAQGMKTNFIYGNWVLAQNESLEIDPDIATLDNPTEDGFVMLKANYFIARGADTLDIFGSETPGPFTPRERAYIEWDVSEIPDGSTITDVIFKYHGAEHGGADAEIRAMASQPTAQSDDAAGYQVIFDDIGDGTVYDSPAGFIEEGTGKEADLGTSANSDLESALGNDWFAIGVKFPADDTDIAHTNIYSEEYATVDPPPTLYVEYTPPVVAVAPWSIASRVAMMGA